MKLADLGYNEFLENFRKDNNLQSFEVGRVIAEHKERYMVWTEKGELEAEITGNMRFTAKSRDVNCRVTLNLFQGLFIEEMLKPRLPSYRAGSSARLGVKQIDR